MSVKSNIFKFYERSIQPNVKYNDKLLITEVIDKRIKSLIVPAQIENQSVVISSSLELYNLKNLQELIFEKGSIITGFDGLTFPKNLKKIILPDSLEYIEDEQFIFLDKMESIVIPNSIKKIGRLAFFGCKSLRSVVFEENSNLESIGSSAFKDTLVTHIVVPKSVKHIEENAFDTESLIKLSFEQDSNLLAMDRIIPFNVSEIMIPKSVVTLSQHFLKNLVKIEFEKGSNLNKISGIFEESSVSEIIIPKHIKKIPSFMFCRSKLEFIYFEEGSELEEIGRSSFAFSKLKSINLPKTVKRIEESAFEGTKLSQIYIPKSVEIIQEKVFPGNNPGFEIYAEHSKLPETWDKYWNYYDEWSFEDDMAFSSLMEIRNIKWSTENRDVEKESHILKVAGVTFDNRQQYIKELIPGQKLLLVREKGNIHDKNAIMVIDMNGQQLGYIPKEYNQIIANNIDKGKTYNVAVLEVIGGNDYNFGIKITVKQN